MNASTFKDRIGLFTILTYFILLFGLMLLDNSSAEQIPDTVKEVNFIKIMQVVLTTLIFILPATLFCRFMRDERTAFLNMNKIPNLYFILTAAACILFALPAVSGLESWNAAMHLPSSMAGTETWMRGKEKEAEKITMMFFQDKSIGGLVVNLLVMAFMAALSEEIFFRGLLQQIFIKNKINPHVAIVIAAILFSAFHLQFFGFIPRMFLGMVLGYLYYITQNLWVSITAHFCNNAIAIIYVYRIGEEISTDTNISYTNTEQLIMIATTVACIIIVIAVLVLLERYANKIKTLL